MLVTSRFRTKPALRSASWLLPGAFLLALVAPAPAQDQHFQQLVSRLPRSANAVLILNMEQALASPMGVREKWKENLAQSFEAGLIRVPPKATRFVLAAQLDFEYMEPIWEAAVMDTSEPVSVERIAEARGGTIDSVADLPAVALPQDVYLVQFAPQTFGAMGPGNRQVVYRWLEELKSDRKLSPYLQGAAVYSDRADTDIILAVDLEGVVGMKQVTSYLSGIELPAQAKKDLASLAQWLSGVRGVRLGIRIGSEPFGKVAVDFRENVSVAPDVAKTLFLGILAKLGMSVSELDGWEPAVSGKEVSLQGTLTKDGLRRVLSVVESPAPQELAERQTDKVASPSDPEAIMATKSLEHFRNVVTLLDDIKKDMKDVANLASMSLWFDRYAKKIERLPILNVDEELLGYSAFVADQLRNASGSVRGMGIQSAVREQSITSSGAGYGYVGGYRYGAYGGYGYGGAVYSPRAEARGVAQERRIVRSQERANMATNVHQIRDQIVAATADIRRKMTQKYQVEF